MVNTALPLPPKRSLTLLLAALYGFCRLILWGICALVGSAARSVANAPLALLPGTLGMPFSFACVVKLGSRRPLRTVSLIAFVTAIFCIVVPVTIIFRGLCGKVSQDNPVPGSRATQPGAETPLIVSAFGVYAIVMLALAGPLSRLIRLTAHFPPVFFAIISTSLICLKSRKASMALPFFICPQRTPVTGLVQRIECLSRVPGGAVTG